MSEAKTWQKRAAIDLPCPSGAVCKVRRPSPEVSLKGGRILNVFHPDTVNARGAAEDLSDEEADQTYVFARQVVLAVVVSPVLSSDRNSEGLTPEDIPPADFWLVFRWAMRGGSDIPVALEEGETTVETVETFPVEHGALNVSSSSSEQVS
jgi:hypothetical protein